VNRDERHLCHTRRRRLSQRCLSAPESKYKRQENWQRCLSLWLSIYLLSFKEFHIASKVLDTDVSKLSFSCLYFGTRVEAAKKRSVVGRGIGDRIPWQTYPVAVEAD